MIVDNNSGTGRTVAFSINDLRLLAKGMNLFIDLVDMMFLGGRYMPRSSDLQLSDGAKESIISIGVGGLISISAVSINLSVTESQYRKNSSNEVSPIPRLGVLTARAHADRSRLLYIIFKKHIQS